MDMPVDAKEHVIDKVKGVGSKVTQHPQVQAVLNSKQATLLGDFWATEKNRSMVARALISTYFFNVWWSSIQMWTLGRQGFPFITIFLVCPAVLLVVNFQMKIVGWVLMAEVAKDSISLLWGVLMTWWHRGVWYLNELMVKKLSMLGCTFLLLLNAFGGTSKQNPLAGMLMADLNQGPTTKQSVILLISRLLVTSLFMWAGQAEIRRQLASVHDDGMGHKIHDRPEGDGHDQLWAKTLQFICSVPLCLGLKTKWFCAALGVVCLLEAWIQWSGLHWYGSGWIYDWAGMGAFYKMHAREHFVVNVGVAGGMILLRNFGAGKYSMDAYMKKQE